MKRAFMGGFTSALLLTLACAHAFPYRYYVIAPNAAGELAGALQGPEPKDDLPIAECAPDEHDKGKCVALKRADWDALRNERVELIERLKACEETRP
jgi:hypothetical protein